MRLIYCDANLATNVGHYAMQCRFLSLAFKSLGVETMVFANRQIDPALAREFAAIGLFSVSPYARTSVDPLCGWLRSFLDVSRILAADFERIQGVNANDLIYYDTATPAPIMALLTWLQGRFTPEQCPRVAIAVIEHSGLATRATGSGQRELVVQGSDPVLYRLVGSYVDPRYQPRVFWTAYEPEVAEVYAQLLGRKVVTVPHPFSATTSRRDRSGTQSITLGFLGAQRPGKGFQLVPDIVERLLERRPATRVVVQNSWPLMTAEMERLQALAASQPGVEVIGKTEDAAGWSALLERCDLLVAPYDRSMYSIAASGIVYEAFANAIPVVVPRGTVMERLLHAYDSPGTLIEDLDPAGVVAAVEAALDAYPDLARRARRASEKWEARNGPARMAQALAALGS